MSRIRLVVFDVVGTTVDDRAGGGSLVTGAVRRAFERVGVEVDASRFRRYRGLAKRDAVAALLAEAGTPSPERIETVSAAVAEEMLAAVDHMREIAGARDAFTVLKRRGVFVGVGSGLPTAALERLVIRLGWRDEGLVDYVASAETVGAGRPSPALVRDAMRRFGVSAARHVLKVGDTVADIEEGKNAGARTAAVMGTLPRVTLEEAGPDVILERLGDVVGLFEG